MDIKKEFIPNPVNERCYTKIFGGYVLFVWHGENIHYSTDINQCAHYGFSIYDYKPDSPSWAHYDYHPSPDFWNKVGIDFKSPEVGPGVGYDKAKYISKSRLEEIVDKLNKYINPNNNQSIINVIKQKTNCSKCNGTGIIDLEFYKRQCMDCCGD